MTNDPPRQPNETDLDLDRIKWEFDKAIRERETSLKERDQETKERDLKLREAQLAASKWSSPLIVAILAAVAAGLVNMVITSMSQGAQRALERERSEQARILEMIKTANTETAAHNLTFLLDAGLITDPLTYSHVKNYLDKRPPGTGPVLSPAVQLSAPVVPGARIFLLTGKKGGESELPALRSALNSAGFGIEGAKYILDTGRSSEPEIRYFYSSDQAQAALLAEFMKFRLNAKMLPANLYKDPKVNPGYIEIWLGSR